MDKELGLSSFSVPSKLFHGREKRHLSSKTLVRSLFDCQVECLSSVNVSTHSKESVLEFPPPPPFAPLTLAAVPSQLGLLQLVYQSRFQKLIPPPPPPPPPPPVVPSSLLPLPALSLPTPDPSFGQPSIPPTPTLSTPSFDPVSAPNQAAPTLERAPSVQPPSPTAKLTPAPSISSLSSSTVLEDEAFDPALLRKLGSLAQIPVPTVASTAPSKKKTAGGGSAANKLNGDGGADEKKKAKKKETKGIGYVFLLCLVLGSTAYTNGRDAHLLTFIHLFFQHV